MCVTEREREKGGRERDSVKERKSERKGERDWGECVVERDKGGEVERERRVTG